MEPIQNAHARKEELMQKILEVFDKEGIKLEKKETDHFMPRTETLHYAKVVNGKKMAVRCYVKCGPEDSEDEADFEENPYEITEGTVYFDCNLANYRVQGDVCNFAVWWKKPFYHLKN
jgi:hypothetical protein